MLPRRAAPIAALAARQAGAASQGIRLKHTVVMMRHGQSEWNLTNRFTGWVDCKLTPLGEEEARSAGQLIKEAGLEFDVAYTSVLQRAIKTLWLSLEESGQTYIPIVHNWRLNERHYGGLTGLNKAETAKKYGDAQVTLWRRSYAVPPPEMDEAHPFYMGNDRRYKDVPKSVFPKTESLSTTADRALPYWKETILPTIKSGKRVLIVAHGNSLRALLKNIDNISEEDIVPLNIPTGIPLVYEFDDNMRPIRHPTAKGLLSGRYLGDAAKVEAAAAAVAAQTKQK